MSAAVADPSPAATVTAARPVRSATAAWTRLIAFAALVLYGALNWATLLDGGGARGRLVAIALAGLLAGVAVHACLRPPRGAAWRRVAVVGLVLVALAVAVLVLAGIPLRLLWPSGWSELATGVDRGLGALPDLLVPYRAPDVWPRIVIVAGGGLLAAAAALAALWPRRDGRLGWPGLATGMAIVLFAVPTIQQTLDHQLVRGAVFAGLLLLWVATERREPRRPAAVAALVAVAVAGALVAAPRLEPAAPWLDYQSLAGSLSSGGGVTFSWDQRYGPMTWARNGRVLLRIQARRPAYWKAENLDVFDGLRWKRATQFGASPDPLEGIPEVARRRADWYDRLRVSVEGLRSSDVIGAGTLLAVHGLGRAAEPSGTGGAIETDPPLHRGDDYVVDVHVPRPSATTLRLDGASYPASVRRDLDLWIPVHPPDDPTATLTTHVSFTPFGSSFATPPARIGGVTDSASSADAMLRGSAYASAYALARQLADESPTPYDFVRRVEEYLSDGFTYSETPPQRSVPLEAFLFRDRIGYCQQFSGAMALLLRMGGVPARVAAGFTTGRRDAKHDDYVVRDTDAHAWVEVYFPSSGWVTFDPTPPAAPARDANAGDATPTAGLLPTEPVTPVPDEPVRRADQRRTPEHAARPAVARRGGTSAAWPWIAAGGALALAVAAGGTLTVRRRHARAGGAAAADPWAAELERALRRAGHARAPALTLAELERRLAASRPAAAAYVRAIQERRYAGRDARPSPRERRALRAALAQGGGVRGRLRALWALPPLRGATAGAPRRSA